MDSTSSVEIPELAAEIKASKRNLPLSRSFCLDGTSSLDGTSIKAHPRPLAARFSAIIMRYMTEIAVSLLPALKIIVGEANVLTAEADVSPYVTDWRDRYHGRARAVVRPATTREVAAVMRCCAEQRVAVVAQGGNTSLCGGATPREDANEVVLSLSRMNRVR